MNIQKYIVKNIRGDSGRYSYGPCPAPDDECRGFQGSGTETDRAQG